MSEPAHHEGSTAPAVDPYSCNGLDTVHSASVKLILYPDGSGEGVVYNRPPVRSDRGDGDRGSYLIGYTVERAAHPRWCHGVEILDLFADRAHWGRAFSSDYCPALVLSARVIASIRNGRNAAVKARRLARANDMRYMSTLTFPTSVTRSEAVALWRLFLKRPGARFFWRGWLMVPEPHDHGGYHLHVLHANRIKAVVIRHAWTAFLLRRGFVLPESRSSVQTHEKYWGSARRAANYAAKYALKAIGDPGSDRISGEHRFYRSQGLSDGAVIYDVPSLAAGLLWLSSGRRVRLFSIPSGVIDAVHVSWDPAPPPDPIYAPRDS